MSSFKKFNEDKLPDKDKFFSSLKDKSFNEKEYERALVVWKVFKIKKLGQCHDLHIKTDVLLVCDIFERFIKTCLEYYYLDSCHYFSAPGLSFIAMLN